MQAPLRKTALSVALLSVGLAMSAMAQNTGSQGTTGGTSAGSSGASSGATSGSTSGSASRSSSGMSGSTSGSSGVPQARATRNSLARADRKFVEDAAKGGMAEVQLGQLAAQKAQSSEVKQFGAAHGRRSQQGERPAEIDREQQERRRCPRDLDRADKREYDRLSKLSGADFDREYMKHMVSDHKKDVSDFRKEAKSGKDADVKNFAEHHAADAEQHLQMAQQTDATVRTANRGGNTAHTSGSGASSGGMSSGGSSSGGASSGGASSGGSTSGSSGASTPGSSSGSTSGSSSGSSSGSTRSGATTGGGTSGTSGK